MTLRGWVLGFGILALAGACAAPPSAPRPRDDDGDTTPDDPNNPTPRPGGDDPNNPDNPSPTPGSCANDVPAAGTGTVDPAVDTFLETKMKESGSPGLSVAVVGGGKIKWAKGYGFANVAEKKPVTSDTLFMLASVSKTITSVALMQLIENPANGITLDSDINGKLPFSVRNPNFQNTAITYRMLLTHTSSLIDSDAYWAIATPQPLHAGDSPIALLSFGRDYVTKTDSWDAKAPGTTYAYSNTAVALIGLLVETIAGKSLQEYSKANIFDRLGMKEASFFLKDLDASHIAIPYGPNLVPEPHYGYPDYPAGQVRTSAPQLAKFLIMFAQNGECGQRLLKEETVTTMETPQVPAIEASQGLIWYWSTKSATKVIGHNGGDQGVSTDMFFDPATGKGFVLLSNGPANTSGVAKQEAAMSAMNNKLMELAKTLP